MSENKQWEVLRGGNAPPCQKVGGQICRGCAGWRAMRLAAEPGGTWQGLVIHCPCTGLTVRSKG